MLRLVPVRILIVDDDESVRRRLVGWLSEAAYDVAAYDRVEPAQRYLLECACQITLLDLRMPDCDPPAVIAALRGAAPRTRVIGLAAFPEAPQLIGAVRAGMRDVLEKPVQQAALLAAIERQLAESGVSVRSEEELSRHVGRRLRAARAAVSRTQAEVAEASGLSVAALSQAELGKITMTTWTLARVCAALDIPLSRVFENGQT
ncbi:Chemotaxis protein CheY [Phycisphaerae bacterium RAS1]|nr:Chemotaxis protein CheY [Phycisphaerae bacterium RAS1]